MKKCPYSAEEIQDEAIKCRYCGEWLDGWPAAAASYVPAGYFGYRRSFEYKTEAELFGLPLVHVAVGYDPKTGAPRVARGVLAVGDMAVGVIAIGGLAVGGLSVGGVSLGLAALGGLAVGGLAAGGAALSAFLSIGGLAISGGYAVGALALAPHYIGANGVDAEFLRLLRSWFPGLGS